MDKVVGGLTRVVTRTINGASKAVTIETSNLAKFADGACTCSIGNTSVLVTVVRRPNERSSETGFTPLTVDYKQKAAAAGRIPMTHLRRDIGITEKEILTSRIIDRSIRPAFPKGFCDDTQIICNLLAVDGLNDPEVLAINGASTCLAISDIPWNGPIGAVRMGLIGENLVANPSRHELENSRLDLVLSANSLGNLLMMDGSCREPVLLPDIQKVIRHGIRECQAIIESIVKLQKANGKPKRTLSHKALLTSEEQRALLNSIDQSKISKVLSSHNFDKASRDLAMYEVRDEAIAALSEKFPSVSPSILSETFNKAVKSTYKKILQETRIRCDGRQFNELRPIDCKVDLYKPLHGSAIFQRGQTQVICSTTFDSPDAAYRTDYITLLTSGVKEKNFMLHYDFPPFATHDIGRVGAMPDRREIGHGALAEKSIRPIVPENQDMTIRLNCEVLESNGSSSMASVCAGSLSLMDSGVTIKEHVAGVAMGLFIDLDEREKDTGRDHSDKEFREQEDYIVLTDILGFEDFIGDMDFKIAGTRKAITALQLDVKPMMGVPVTIIYKAILKAHNARSEIINKMDKVIKEPRKDKKDSHPVIKTIHVPPHKKAKFVGFGGANLKKLTTQIGVRISEYQEDGTNGDENSETVGAVTRDNFIVFAPNKDAMKEADDFIAKILEKQFREPELEFNGIYTATIEEILPSGVMVTLYPSMTPTLLHVSQLDIRPVKHPDALKLEVGQQIQVKYFGRDPASGHMRLSRKSLLMTSTSRVHRSPVG